MANRAPRKRRDCVKMGPQPRAPADPDAAADSGPSRRGDPPASPAGSAVSALHESLDLLDADLERAREVLVSASAALAYVSVRLCNLDQKIDRALEEARQQGAREQSQADQETEIEVKHG